MKMYSMLQSYSSYSSRSNEDYGKEYRETGFPLMVTVFKEDRERWLLSAKDFMEFGDLKYSVSIIPPIKKIYSKDY